MISPYIPYSKRHGIEDENLAHLLDYLERVEAWDIEITRDPSVYWFDILHKWWRLHIDNELSQTVTLIHRDPPPQKEKDAKEPAGKITFKIISRSLPPRYLLQNIQNTPPRDQEYP